MRLIKPLLLFLICTYGVAAQTDFGTWFTYKNNAKLSDNFTFNNQIDYRSFDVDFDDDQILVTSGFSYALSTDISLSAGYRFLEAKNNFVEHGMYQKISIKTSLNKLKITNKFGVEERWINGDLVWRYRAGVDLGIPLSEKIDLVLSEEVFLMNQGTSFNQNRLAVKTVYSISDAFKLNTGLMHWQFNNFHRWVMQFTLTHSLDLRGAKD